MGHFFQINTGLNFSFCLTPSNSIYLGKIIFCNMNIQNDLFLKAAKRLECERTPVWMMRQAGRYLPEYRAIRKKYDFLTMCKTPELAAEVTIQPVDILGVDAAIIFSDILVLPEAMGMKLIIEEGKGGPRFPNPIRTTTDINDLSIPDPYDKLKYLLDAIALTKKNLSGRVPLIGFSGSSWTLATYMVEGKGKENFHLMRDLIVEQRKDLHKLLDMLARAIAKYLSAQIEAGANAVQIFDTWGGILPEDKFEEFSLNYIEQIISEIQRKDEPIIVFCKDSSHSLEKIAKTGCDVVGLDWTVDIGEARKTIGHLTALQGNLNPHILLENPEVIIENTKVILEKYGKGTGHIFNLGHGILPETPVENAKILIQTVKEESKKYHQ